MGRYITLDKDLSGDPQLLELADVLAASFTVEVDEAAAGEGRSAEFGETDLRDALCNALLGGLVRLWTYADIYIRSDNSLPLSLGAAAQIMRLPEWIVDMYPVKWVTVRGTDECVVLPNYVEKNGIMPRDVRKETKEEQRNKWREAKRRQRQRTYIKESSRTGRGQSKDGSMTRPPVHPPVHHTVQGVSDPPPGPITHTRGEEASPGDRPSSAPPVSLARDTKDLARPAGSHVGNGKAAEPVATLEDRLGRARQLLAANPGVTDVALKITCGLNGTQVAELRAAQSEPLE